MKKLHNSIIALEIFLITVSLVFIGLSNKTLSFHSALALVPELPAHTLVNANQLNHFASMQSMVQGLVVRPGQQTSSTKTTEHISSTSQVPKTLAPQTGESAQPAQSKPVNEADTINVTYSHVVIPSVGIDAPITWNVDGRDMNAYLPVLSHSIAHYDWTPFPGQGGSTLLFGHSSYTYNLPNNYDEVFAPLFDMKNGDKVYVVYQGELYVYEMYQSATIVPTNPEFISQDGPERVMLMTCAPLGSQKYRLLVYAKRIK